MFGRIAYTPGHNRYDICTKHGLKFATTTIKLDSRESAELWIEEHQVGRRNLSDDQKAMLWDSIRERRSAIEKKNRAQKAREAGGDATPEQKEKRLSDNVSDKRSEGVPGYIDTFGHMFPKSSPESGSGSYYDAGTIYRDPKGGWYPNCLFTYTSRLRDLISHPT